MKRKRQWQAIAAILIGLKLQAVNMAATTVDIGFAGTAGRYYEADAAGSVASLYVLPDGKVLVGSNEMPVAEGEPPLQVPLVRFNVDGSVDGTFFADTEAFGSGLGIYYDNAGWPEVMAIGRQSDGKIIAAGVMEGMRDGTNTVVSRNIVRINPDDTVDASFQTRGTTPWPSGQLNYINHLIVEPDDKILLTGGFGGIREMSNVIVSRFGIARLHADGTLDTGFHIDPAEFGVPVGAFSVRGVIYHASRASDGSYYIAGNMEWSGGSISLVARLNADGSRDWRFAPLLPDAVEWRGIAVEPDGKVVALGYRQPGGAVMLRFASSGAVDPTFAFNGAGKGILYGWPLEADSAGRYLLHGEDKLYRVLPNGGSDPDFAATAAWVHTARTHAGFNTSAVAADGSIYAGGFFDDVNGVETVKLVRFEDEAVADSFAWSSGNLRVAENSGTVYLGVVRRGSAAAAGSINYATVDGSAIAGIDYSATSGTLSWPAGSSGILWIPLDLIDNATTSGSRSFSVLLSSPTGGGLSGPASVTVTIEDDEAAPEIIAQPIGGSIFSNRSFSLSVSVGSAAAVSFQWQVNYGEGYLDISGATGAMFTLTNPIRGISDGLYRVVVTNANGSATSDAASIQVIAQPGALDPLFSHAGAGFNQGPSAAAILNDGKILVVGNFSTFNGVSTGTNGILRLNADGSRDPAWNPGEVGPSSPVNVRLIAVYPEHSPNAGKVIIAGSFRSYNGVSVAGAVRLHADGRRDLTWSAGTMISSDSVHSLTLLPDDSVLLGYNYAGLRKLGGDAVSYDNPAGFALRSVVMPDGSIVTLYMDASLQLKLQRNFATGNVDDAFPDLTGMVQTYNGMVVGANGAILISGIFQRPDETTFTGLLRLLPNGYVDTDFVVDLSLQVHQPLIDANGNILLMGGEGNSVNGIAVSPLFRLLPDGSIDSEFYSATAGRPQFVDAFGRVHSTINGAVVRHALGYGLVQFAEPAITVNEDATSVELSVERFPGEGGAVAVDWQITGGTAQAGMNFSGPTSGTLTWADGDSAPQVISLTLINSAAAGDDLSLTMELSNPPTGWRIGSKSSVAVTIINMNSPPRIIQPPLPAVAPENTPVSFTVSATSPLEIQYQWLKDGDEITGADQSSYTIPSLSFANAGNYSVRVSNANGPITSDAVKLTVLPAPTSVEAGWTTQPSFSGPSNYSVHVITPLGDGRALIGGNFNTARAKIALVNADGSVDTSFPQASNNNAHGVNSIVIQPDGKILIGGVFTQFAGQNINNLVRLNADYSVDTDFLVLLNGAPTGAVVDISLQEDGKILLAGQFNQMGDHGSTRGIARLNPNGSVDTTFNSLFSGTNPDFRKVIAMEDGRILTAGNFVGYQNANRIVRLHADGTRDMSFSSSHANNLIRAMLLLPDGRILIGGDFTTTSRPRIARLEPNGSLDTNFLSGVTVVGNVHALVQQVNGRIAVAGNFTTFGTATIRFTRLNPDGSIDTTLSTGSGFNATVDSLAVDTGGDIWAGGAFTQYQNVNRNRIVRLSGDRLPLATANQPRTIAATEGGSYQIKVNAAGFGPLSYQWFVGSFANPLSDGDGISGSDTTTLTIADYSIARAGTYFVQVTNVDGDIIIQPVANLSTVAEPVIQRQPQATTVASNQKLLLTVDAVGAADLNFAWTRNGNPVGTNKPYLMIINATLEDSGEYVVTVSNAMGSLPSSPAAVTVVASEAVPDSVFPALAGANGIVLPLADGRLAIGGSFTTVRSQTGASVSRTRFAIYHADGKLDDANPAPNGIPTTLAELADGSILVGGPFTQFGGIPAQYIARLRPDLSHDTTFNQYLGVFQTASSVAGGLDAVVPLPDGRILIAGGFASINQLAGTTALAILHPEGTVDTRFVSPITTPTRVNAVLVDSDGRILVALPSGINQPSNGFMRMSIDGVLDTSFAPDLPVGSTKAMAMAPDDSVVLIGNYGTRKLRSDGSLDPVFGQEATVFEAVNAVAVQADGKVVLGGAFSYFDGPAQRMVRLSSDGSVDTLFSVGSGFNGNVNSLAIAADGRIFASGAFTTFSDSTVNNLAVLRGAPTGLAFSRPPRDVAVNPGATLALSAIAVGSSPVSYQWFFGPQALMDDFRISGSDTETLSISGFGAADAGTYTLRISNESGHLEADAEANLLGSPQILTDPLSTLVFADTRISLRATGRAASPATWQWFRDGEPIDGANDFVLIIADAQPSASGSYHAELSSGDESASSVPASVNVILNPAGFASGFAFNAGIGNSGMIQAVLPLPDGSVLIGGSFNQAGISGSLQTRTRMARFLADGTLDSGFNPAPNQNVEAMALDATGGILVSGIFSTIADTSTRFARLFTDGSIDSDYAAQIGSGPDSQVNVILPLPSGKVLVGGNFSTWNGAVRRGLVRLNSNGSVDAAFNPNLGNFPSVMAVSLQGSQILVGGSNLVNFGSHMVRLNSNGDLDGSFSAVLNQMVYAIAVAADNLIYVGGQFSNVSGDPQFSRLVRLLPNGALDTSFTPGPVAANVRSLIVDSSGRLLASGAFTSINGSGARLARLLADGSADPLFQTGTGFSSGEVRALALDNGGRIWSGGFGGNAQFNSTFTLGLIVLNGGPDLDPVGPSPLTGFAQWLTGLPEGRRGADDELFANGIRNLHRYLFGLSTDSADSADDWSGLPRYYLQTGTELGIGGATADQQFLVLELDIRSDADGVSWQVEAAFDLDSFASPMAPLPVQIGAPVNQGAIDRYRFRSPSPVEISGSLFLRVSIAVE